MGIIENPNEAKPNIDFKSKVNPFVASLPEHLKDPRNYEKIQKAILNTFRSTCDHSDILEWSKCKKCTEKMMERRILLRNLGFKNSAQYMAWRKIHETIRDRVSLMDWKTGLPLK